MPARRAILRKDLRVAATGENQVAEEKETAENEAYDVYPGCSIC
jgi:hypothetical protein